VVTLTHDIPRDRSPSAARRASFWAVNFSCLLISMLRTLWLALVSPRLIKPSHCRIVVGRGGTRSAISEPFALKLK